MRASLVGFDRTPEDLLPDAAITDDKGGQRADFEVDGVPASLEQSWVAKLGSSGPRCALSIEGDRFDLIPRAMELLGMTEENIVFRNEEWVRLPECEQGMAYRVNSRNLTVAVFDGKDGFVGIREKWGDEYLFTEYHYDTGSPFGTVLPRESLARIPEGMSLDTADNPELLAWLAEQQERLTPSA